MATELPNGVVIVDGGDSGSTLGLAYGSSVDSLIGGITESRQLQTFSWVNAAARTAQTGMMPGDFGYQTDTQTAYQYDGSEWKVLVPSPIIAQGTVTAQSVIAIDGLTGASRYEVALNLPTASTGNAMTFRLRSGGVPNTASQYYRVRVSGTGSAASVSTVSAADQSGSLFISSSTQDKLVLLNIYNLNDNLRTVLEMRSSGSSAPGSEEINEMTFWHRGATAFDGIEFNVSPGTVTGTYTVRGQ